ncbi:MAG: ABC-F type ribosomal protection protein [Eubacteriales bacterium]|nr:ABC-F type ribosomal protection protein [Eubacteriales bacterium]
MAQINVSHLTFGYDGSFGLVFDDVSFQLDTDWKLGFTARNGRGKTTLLKLLMGEYPYQGSISCPMAFDYYPAPVDDPSLPAREVALRHAPQAQLWQLMREINQLEVREEALEQPFDSLSNGEQAKVLLAGLFLRDNRFLLIDEPTNHLDSHGRELVARYLNRKKGFILVSHDRVFLDACVDHILAINKTDIEVTQGNFSTWWQQKALRDDYELAQNQKLKKEIRRLDQAAREKAEWSDQLEKTKHGTRIAGLRPDRGHIGHQSAKMMKRAKTIENRRLNAAEQKGKLLGNIEQVEALKIQSPPFYTNRLVSLRKVAIGYGPHTVCQNINLDIETGDRVALLGPNGSGKTSLLKLVCGQPVEYTGQRQVPNGLKISYVSQTTAQLRGDLADYARERALDESLLKTILRKMDFSREQFGKDMAAYSGGQKKKVLLAASLCEQAHLYVWDEPLNFIDVFTRIQLEELLLSFRPTILFVEHDKAFCARIATKTVQL